MFSYPLKINQTLEEVILFCEDPHLTAINTFQSNTDMKCRKKKKILEMSFQSIRHTPFEKTQSDMVEIHHAV